MKDKFITMSNDAYHGDPRISVTGIKRFMRSPLHYHGHENPSVKPKAFVVGNATHTLFLEPHKFEGKYRVKPLEVDGQGPRTKHYKEWLFHQDPTITWLDQETHDLILGMADSALAHPILNDLVQGMVERVVEGSLFFKHQGVECKARPDLTVMCDDGTVDVLDLKTTQDASPEGFAKVAWNLGYGVQEYVYRLGLESAGLKVNRFLFLAVEKTPPYACCVHVLERDWVTKSGIEVDAALRGYRQCLDADAWPSYGEAVNTLRLPRWARGGQDAPSNNGWLTVKEATKLLGITRATLYNWMNKDKSVKRKKQGGRRLVDAASLQAAMKGA